jgi:hypothetical protein
VADRPHGAGCDPLAIALTAAASARETKAQHQRLCIKGEGGASADRAQNHDNANTYRSPRPSSLCLDCNTSRVCADGHFSAHGMPDGARVVSLACGQRVERLPRDPQVPLSDALGGPGSRLSPVSIPRHGTGDSGGKARLLETFNKEIAGAPTKLTGEHAPTSLRDMTRRKAMVPLLRLARLPH